MAERLPHYWQYIVGSKCFFIMAIREKIIENGKATVHFVGVGQQDYALCGQDLAGDSALGYEESQVTKEKVSCRDCIAIVEYCQSIKRSEWQS